MTEETEVKVRTGGRHDLVNVTDLILGAVRESGVQVGMACASVPHTTCALLVNEDEPGLREDILRLMVDAIEPVRRKGPFAHDRVDHNAQAHLTSLLLHHSLVLPISRGRPLLGTWQSVFLAEMDGPRTRTLRITCVGD